MSWVICRRYMCFVEHYYQRCLRTILTIPWSDIVTNLQGLEMAMVTRTEDMLLKLQPRMAVHVSVMADYRLPKIFKKITHHLLHRTSPVENAGSRSRDQATHRQPGYLLSNQLNYDKYLDSRSNQESAVSTKCAKQDTKLSRNYSFITRNNLQRYSRDLICGKHYTAI